MFEGKIKIKTINIVFRNILLIVNNITIFNFPSLYFMNSIVYIKLSEINVLRLMNNVQNYFRQFMFSVFIIY